MDGRIEQTQGYEVEWALAREWELAWDITVIRHSFAVNRPFKSRDTIGADT